jgi:hypothetical protein
MQETNHSDKDMQIFFVLEYPKSTIEKVCATVSGKVFLISDHRKNFSNSP